VLASKVRAAAANIFGVVRIIVVLILAAAAAVVTDL
jgi:hypothetical protein